MKTGLSKAQKTTSIFFDEKSPWIEVNTHNTALKKRLKKYADEYPDECSLTDDDGQGGLSFEIRKGRLSFRLTAPYSVERRQKMRQRDSQIPCCPMEQQRVKGCVSKKSASFQTVLNERAGNYMFGTSARETVKKQTIPHTEGLCVLLQQRPALSSGFQTAIGHELNEKNDVKRH